MDTVSGGAWKAVLVAEYLCGGDGLGVRIAWARQMADVEASMRSRSLRCFSTARRVGRPDGDSGLGRRWIPS